VSQARRSRSQAAPARRQTSRSDAAQLLALTDRIYQAGSHPDTTSSWLAELAQMIGAATCKLEEQGGPSIVGSAPAERRRGATGARAAARKPEVFEIGDDRGLLLVVECAGGLSVESRALVHGLAPHILRARGTVSATATRPGADNIPAVALDHLAVGVLVVDEKGGLLHANKAGSRMLEAGEGVDLVAGRIEVARTPAATILADLRSRTEGGRRSRPSARISVGRGERPALEVFAISVDGMEVGDHSALALFLSDPESGLEPPPSVLREHYGLSRRESEVVGQILIGRSLDETATALGIHRETVRMHLKQVFKKIGTRRQVDLVRLLLTGVPRLRWD